VARSSSASAAYACSDGISRLRPSGDLLVLAGLEDSRGRRTRGGGACSAAGCSDACCSCAAAGWSMGGCSAAGSTAAGCGSVTCCSPPRCSAACCPATCCPAGKQRRRCQERGKTVGRDLLPLMSPRPQSNSQSGRPASSTAETKASSSLSCAACMIWSTELELEHTSVPRVHDSTRSRRRIVYYLETKIRILVFGDNS
jgi:hypothetical protein